MNALIIGGTSGLGLELAKQLRANDFDQVTVTGRHDPKVKGITYQKFDLTLPNLSKRATELVGNLPEVDLFVYAAGYFQEGKVTDLSDEQIEEMIDVGGRGLIYFTKSLLAKQDNLKGLITITSTSQWTPRQVEPIYNFAKAGAGHFTNAIAEDGRVVKVMVAGPAGMDTAFWEGTEGHDTSTMLNASWVAEQVMDQWDGMFKYKFVRILRQPARVEVVEER